MANKILKTRILQQVKDSKNDLSLNDKELGFYRDGNNIKACVQDNGSKKDLVVASDSSKADKSYVDTQDGETLASAKAYTDSVIASAETGVSKEYVDTQNSLKLNKGTFHLDESYINGGSTYTAPADTLHMTDIDGWGHGRLSTTNLTLGHIANPGEIRLDGNTSALLTQTSSVETLEIGVKDAQELSGQLGLALDCPDVGTAGITLTNEITGQKRMMSMANVLDGAGQFTTVSYYRAESNMTYSTDSLSSAFIGYKLADKVPLNSGNLGEIKIYETDGFAEVDDPISTLDNVMHVGYYGAELYYSNTDLTKGLLFMPHTQCAPEIYDDGKSGWIPDQVGFEISEGVYYVNPSSFLASSTHTLNDFTVAPAIGNFYFVPATAGIVDKNTIAPIRNFTTDLRDGEYDGDIEYDQGSVHHIWLYRSFTMDAMYSTWGSLYEGSTTLRVPKKIKYYQYHEIIPVWQQAAYEFEKNIRSDNFGSAYSNGDLPLTLYAYRGTPLGDSWVYGIVLLHFWGERHCDKVLMTGDYE